MRLISYATYATILTTCQLTLCGQIVFNHGGGTAIRPVAQAPIQAEKEPVKSEKPETEKDEYRLVMLTADWCNGCEWQKNAFMKTGVDMSDSEYDKTPVLLIDIDKHPDWINGRKVKKIPQFILQKKENDEWIEVPKRGEVGPFDARKLRKKWPELRCKPIPQLAKKPKDGHKMICGCRGVNAKCCLCLQEIRAGIRSKGCGCGKQKGSVHKVENLTFPWNPKGATGEYRPLKGYGNGR